MIIRERGPYARRPPRASEETSCRSRSYSRNGRTSALAAGRQVDQAEQRLLWTGHEGTLPGRDLGTRVRERHAAGHVVERKRAEHGPHGLRSPGSDAGDGGRLLGDDTVERERRLQGDIGTPMQGAGYEEGMRFHLPPRRRQRVKPTSKLFSRSAGAQAAGLAASLWPSELEWDVNLTPCGPADVTGAEETCQGRRGVASSTNETDSGL